MKECEWAVTDAKKECEEVVTNTTATSFIIGAPRFKKKKKKTKSRVICIHCACSHPCLTWVHFEAWARGANVDAHFFTKLRQIERAVGTICHEPKRASNNATQEGPKMAQPTIGPEDIGSFQEKAICCKAQKIVGNNLL